MTLANSTANKIYIAVADLVNEHKAGTGIEITNNTDGTRTIGITDAVNTKINNSLKSFGKAVDPVLLAYNNAGSPIEVFKAGDGLKLSGISGSDDPFTLDIATDVTTKIDTAKSQSDTNKTNLEALTKRVDGIVATGGEANQDAYSNIKVGSTTLAATSKTDTVVFAGGTNISASASNAAGSKSVSFSHATPTGAAAKTTGFYKFATDATGHATNLTAVADSDITALIGAHSLTLSKTNAENDAAAITIGSTSYTVGPIPLGDSTNPAEGTVHYILNH